MPRRQHVLELSCTRSAWSRLSALFFFTFTGSIHDYYSKCTDSQLNKIDEDREGLRVRVRVSEGWHLQEQQFVLMHELPTDEQWYMPSLATQVNAWESSTNTYNDTHVQKAQNPKNQASPLVKNVVV